MNNNLQFKNIHNQSTKQYEEYLSNKNTELMLKYIFDKLLALLLVLLLCPFIILISIWIKIDSKGPVFFRQERVTKNGKIFRIFKFRTMIIDADKKGSLVTIGEDDRITTFGQFARKYRIDELPQLFNVLMGDMSFVGVRPEVKKYVEHYSDEMMATLLLPAGITSPASITFKNENKIMMKYAKLGMTPDEAYIEKILPEKMRYNLDYINNFTLFNDLRIIFQTVFEVIK